ncbi:MAG: beta galactosidase jelly roll domain-containing protein [Bacteroidetes bacterium]|nr:beta galactosidase jelly roll domain-containing protein [Bacteroidota bacterium]
MIRYTIHIALLLLLIMLQAHAQKKMDRVIDLSGDWKFEIGDNPSWAKSDFDDTQWDEIRVPDFWENQGYPGYDGWAWYRSRFVLPSSMRNDALFLSLGNVDDVDEVYVNGQFFAFQGSPPPHYVSAYADPQWFYLPAEYLRFNGENVIAVRVYDNEMYGGIIRGPIGIYRESGYLVPDQSLRGPWKLSTGDGPERARVSYDDRGWMTVLVPAYWETQGLRGYDGFGWYRREFTLDPALRDQRLILLLGRIDDVDEVWVNGRSIGKTGRMPSEGNNFYNDDSYKQLRAYFIPPDLLRKDGGNVIAVRVYDGFMHGGIYEGPIGLVRQDRYRAWNKKHPQKKDSVIRDFFDAIFGR